MIQMDSILCILLISILGATKGFKIHPFIQTSTGAISGSRITVLDKEVHRYFGIPYAVPPTGDLRFKKPVAVTGWEGLYEATDKPAPCVQYNAQKIPLLPKDEDVSEDCLYLNLWVPNPEGRNRRLLPIMVWIHGGSFVCGESGSDIYDGGVLAAYGEVIVASMNYRLGVFGFLNAKVDEAPGNMGLLDQVLALKWIKTNAKTFGGDPDQIIIFGDSAGSMSAGLHLLSPLSQGLFSRVIMQSGTPFHPQWGGESSRIGVAKGDKLARAVGCSDHKQTLSSHPHEVVECLKSKDAMDLAKAQTAVIGNVLGFLPQMGDEFIPHSSISVIQDGNFNLTKVLTGVTSNEGALFLLLRDRSFFLQTKPSKWTLEHARDYMDKFCLEMGIDNREEVIDYYLSGIKDGDELMIAQALFDIQGDYLIVCPEILFSDYLSKLADSAIYFYLMDHHPSVSFLKPWVRMTHFDDVQFVFGVPLRMKKMYSKIESELTRSVMDKWINFVKTGNPNGPGGEQWPRYTSEDRAYLEIKTEDQTVRHLHELEKRCQFWKKRFLANPVAKQTPEKEL